jgi:hypothetical protein
MTYVYYVDKVDQLFVSYYKMKKPSVRLSVNGKVMRLEFKLIGVL